MAKYHKEHPYAASHPYSRGRKIKPEGAPAPYPAYKDRKMNDSTAKSEALRKKSLREFNRKSPEMKLARKGYNNAMRRDTGKTKRGAFKVI